MPKPKGARSKIPDDFKVSEKFLEEAASKGWPDPREHIEQFRAHHEAQGSMLVNWEAALRLWMLNEIQWAVNRGKPLKPMQKPKAAQTEMNLKPKGLPELTEEQRRENMREFGKLWRPLVKAKDVRNEQTTEAERRQKLARQAKEIKGRGSVDAAKGGRG